MPHNDHFGLLCWNLHQYHEIYPCASFDLSFRDVVPFIIHIPRYSQDLFKIVFHTMICRIYQIKVASNLLWFSTFMLYDFENFIKTLVRFGDVLTVVVWIIYGDEP